MNWSSIAVLVGFYTLVLTVPCYASPVDGPSLAMAAVFLLGWLLFVVAGPIWCFTYKIHSVRQCNYMSVLIAECFLGIIVGNLLHSISGTISMMLLVCGLVGIYRVSLNWDKRDVPSPEKSRADKLALIIILVPPVSIGLMLLVGMLSKL